MNDKYSKYIDELVKDINAAHCEFELVNCIHTLCNLYENGIINHRHISKFARLIFNKNVQNYSIDYKVELNKIKYVLSTLKSKCLKKSDNLEAFKNSVRMHLNSSIQECYRDCEFYDLILQAVNSYILGILDSKDEYAYYMERIMNRYFILRSE